MGVLLQNLLSISNKYRSPLPATMLLEPFESISSYPIQWQVYGSGPRLTWEWLAVFVLVVVLLSLSFGMYQTLRYRTGPGLWVELGGMMMLAQTSPSLDDMENEEKAQKRIYWVENSAQKKKLLRSKVS
ncbi:hypothetical protein GQ44DRAFT_766163 [Phaeosphaeriaceae sp. PMI808]|nr:hypothetical protein GQ44DRAFT_766163 [Phaeosphaeriaceae sp. PMI808]